MKKISHCIWKFALTVITICAFAVLAIVMEATIINCITTRSLIPIAYGVLETALIFAEFVFVYHTEKTRLSLRRIKKEYSLAPVEVKPGHSGHPKADIQKLLNARRIEFGSWLAVCIVCTYAIFDCFAWIFGD